ncbi:MAG TPA: VWA domain-containing protein [Acidimicrobiales bacterium]|nr:VWA domain-containing protein [Acidimicrobiales bacterium]
MNADAPLDRVDLAELTGAFGQLLHAAGVPVSPERSGRFATAVSLVRPADLDEWYWAGRVTLLSGRDDIETYDRVFGQVFRGLADVADWRGQWPPPPPARRPATAAPRGPAVADDGAGSGDREPRPGSAGADPTSPAPAGAEGDAGDGTPDVLAAASAEERLRRTDFAHLTDDELAALGDLMAALPPAAPRRARRRTRPDPRGRRLDLRATLRRARATGGDPARRRFRRRTERPRHLVLIADVSGSMAPYARAYLHLLHGAVRATRADAFVFATRLTRLTRQLRATDPELALRRALDAAPDWSGGTRIAEALREFLDGYGRRGMARGAVVVIVSDGWDTGDPADLGEQMARLSRLAHRVVWVNPRKAAAGYQPLVAGMAAALPHVDAFVSGHSVAALDEVLEALGDQPGRGISWTAQPLPSGSLK